MHVREAPKQRSTPALKVVQKRKGLLAAELLLRTIPTMYAPGEKLPSERLLAQEMGISRNTLREAIGALSLAGLLDLRSCTGNFVREMPNPEQAVKVLRSLFASHFEPFTFLDARIAFEPGIVQLASSVAGPNDIRAIGDRLDSLVQSLRCGDSTAYSATDKEFHLSIARATNNNLITQSLQSLIGSLHTPLWGAMKSSIDVPTLTRGRVDEHTKIFRNLEERDGAAAGQAMREHLINSRRRLMGEDIFFT